MRIIRKVSAVLGWIVLGVVILTTLFVLWGNKKGWEFDVVLSGSMEPKIHVGGLVVIKPVNIDTLQVGDIISFKVPDATTPVCHRITDVQFVRGFKYFETKGDANEEPDEYLTLANDVNGRSVFYIPYAGSFLNMKNMGTTQVSIPGRKLPLAIIVVLAIGTLFIGLTFKDVIDDSLHPGRALRQKMAKAHLIKIEKRRKLYNPA
jgi:signal peptidase I